MLVLGKSLLVKELKKDLVVDGITQRYDDSNAYMFVEAIEIGEDLHSIPALSNNGAVIIIKRIAKVPFIENMYFIHYDDILAIMDREEYDAL